MAPGFHFRTQPLCAIRGFVTRDCRRNVQTPSRSAVSPPANPIAPAAASREAGLTLLELVVTCAIIVILSTAALPIARFTYQRQRESILRADLREMRDAIDRYKDLADHQQIQVKVGTEGYPPDLDTLVKGVQLTGAPDRHIRFLRHIPVDPITGKTDWGERSVQDDADSNSWGGQDVFDVFSKSTDTGLDGTKYNTW